MSTEETNQEQTDPTLHFSMVAALAIYENNEGQVKQRHVNVMLETEHPAILRRDLDQVNHGVISRVVAENGINPEKFMDIVILSVNRLAICTRQEFYDFSDEEMAAMNQQEEPADSAT